MGRESNSNKYLIKPLPRHSGEAHFSPLTLCLAPRYGMALPTTASTHRIAGGIQSGARELLPPSVSAERPSTAGRSHH